LNGHIIPLTLGGVALKSPQHVNTVTLKGGRNGLIQNYGGQPLIGAFLVSDIGMNLSFGTERQKDAKNEDEFSAHPWGIYLKTVLILFVGGIDFGIS
jgi:hypothetical protein